MALKNDHSAMPPREPGEGFPPDPIPRFGLSLVQAWADADIPDGEKPHAVEGTSFRLSWAGKCARDMGYWMNGLEPSNPLDLADYWRMGLGTMVHEHLQTMFTTASRARRSNTRSICANWTIRSMAPVTSTSTSRRTRRPSAAR
jgi:hypothetical protein